jgi:nicotinate phosphoribosyltransferase
VSIRWVNDENSALLTDLYELTMLQGYWKEQMFERAVFSLHCRSLGKHRNYLLAAGLDDALHFLETLRFNRESCNYLASLGLFEDGFLAWLAEFRFTGDVYAVPEGTPIFENEPLLEVEAPLPEGQLIESFLMNQLHHQTVVASKAARVVAAAGEKAKIVDFGLRRMHGADAALKAARAFAIAGVKATSNVLAGHAYGIRPAGTMAHSFIQAHEDELGAFRAFARTYPETILLVDTYDSLEGVQKVIQLARELGEDFRVRGIRLDSGDLAELALEARRMLDAAGLRNVEIFASGGLDEYEIERILAAGAPITGFGVGTYMGVARDQPCLDMAYKLTEYAGKGRVKTSPGKPIFPGRKQVFRVEENGVVTHDVIACHEENQPGRRLLEAVMREGRCLPAGQKSLEEICNYAAEEIQKLPADVRALEKADPAYPVEISERLRAWQEQVIERVTKQGRGSTSSEVRLPDGGEG